MKISISIQGLDLTVDTEKATPQAIKQIMPLIKEIVNSPNIGEYREAWLAETKEVAKPVL